MQDIHTIAVGGGGRLFGGAERRMRPHHHHHHHHHQGHGVGQSPKCPRCESVNTKFCYYNNYNLSQPRHFCKSCRRYWTKGGVLRNVPVGGGCRKAKRNSKAPSEKKNDADDNNSQSSSESSSITASVAVTENVSDHAPPLCTTEASPSAEQTLARSPPPKIIDFSQGITNPILDSMMSFSDPSDGCEIGSFTSLMTSSSNPMMGFDFGYQLPLQSDGKAMENHGSTNQQWTRQHETTTTMPEELKMQEISGGYLDPTAEMDLSGRHHGGLETLDQELFGDLTVTVDQSYWNQPQWTDVSDHTLYLP